MKDINQLIKNNLKNLRKNNVQKQMKMSMNLLIRKNGGMTIKVVDMEVTVILVKDGVMDNIQDGEIGMDTVDRNLSCGIKHQIKIKSKEIKDLMLYLVLLLKILRFLL
jgi:hypothetical protein